MGEQALRQTVEFERVMWEQGREKPGVLVAIRRNTAGFLGGRKRGGKQCMQ